MVPVLTISHLTKEWLGNFLDNILSISSCYEDIKTIMTGKSHAFFSDGVLP